MKTACLCLLTMVSAALLSGRAYAARPDNSSSEAKPRTEQPEHGRVVSKVRPAVHSAVVNSGRPHAVAKDQARGTPASPTALHALPPVRPSSAPSRGSTHNEAIYQALPVRPGSVALPGVAASNVRHRNPNAAVIGGGAISNRTVAALDGSKLNLKGARN